MRANPEIAEHAIPFSSSPEVNRMCLGGTPADIGIEAVKAPTGKPLIEILFPCMSDPRLSIDHGIIDQGVHRTEVRDLPK